MSDEEDIRIGRVARARGLLSTLESDVWRAVRLVVRARLAEEHGDWAQADAAAGMIAVVALDVRKNGDDLRALCEKLHGKGLGS